MCALEMAALEIHDESTGGSIVVTEDNINKTIESLEDDGLKDFIRKCLSHDPSTRPAAKQLLFHPLLFEVHSLKLLAAHVLIQQLPPAGSFYPITQPVVTIYRFLRTLSFLQPIYRK